MLRILGVSGVFFLVACAVQAQTDDKNRQDAARLSGTWVVVAEEKNGKQETADSVKEKKVRITGSTITCMDKAGKAEMSAQYKLDTTSKPWRIELTGMEGEHKDKKMKGIAELTGDTLKICHSKP